jgi:hypothetical protein
MHFRPLGYAGRDRMQLGGVLEERARLELMHSVDLHKVEVCLRQFLLEHDSRCNFSLVCIESAQQL